MQRILLFLTLTIALKLSAFAQVTQLASNNSLEIKASLGKNKVVLVEAGYKKLWVTDATTGGTFKLSDTLTYDDAGGVLNGKFIFAATSPNLGSELWITDGTLAGTTLLKDIYPGKTGAEPHDNFALLNGYLYFSAATEGIGRELWRTNGTPEGTTLVKDIVSGPAGSGLKNTYKLFSTGTYLLFSTPTYTEGYELWRSDGTEQGTYMLKDINPGFPSSEISAYQMYGNTVLFQAKTAAEGVELWKTDGTTAGTQLVKDIRPGSGSSFNYLSLYPFNGKLLFIADDGTTGEELWVTDGTTGGTVLLNDINPGADRSFVSLANVMPVENKLLFFAYKEGEGSELWQTDGTPSGTTLFKEILPGLESGVPHLMPNSTGLVYQGAEFYFFLGLPLGGVELWKSDGTAAGTTKVKTIKTTDNKIENVSYVYTTAGIYFSIDDGVHGHELWKSDGTVVGTALVSDLNPSGNSDAVFLPGAVNNQILFTATNGDDGFWRDLYRLDGNLVPLPVKMESFTVSLVGADAQLRWQTGSEEATREFLIERSDDGNRFLRIGAVSAAGTSTDKRAYTYNDVAIAGSGRQVLYYRLTIKDRDGKETQSKVVSVNLKGGVDFTVQILGNPVQSELRLSFSKVAAPVALSIKDASGRTVKAMQVKAETGVISFPAGSLLPGAYFLVAEQNGKSSVTKFIKQ